MKTLYMVAAVLFSVQIVSAQIQPLNPENLLQLKSTADLLTTANAPKAVLIRETNLGKIYAMPQDNMPCLVPNMSLQNSMPVYATPSTTLMPNAFPKQDYFTVPLNNTLLLKPAKSTPEASKNLMLDLLRKK